LRKKEKNGKRLNVTSTLILKKSVDSMSYLVMTTTKNHNIMNLSRYLKLYYALYSILGYFSFLYGAIPVNISRSDPVTNDGAATQSTGL